MLGDAHDRVTIEPTTYQGWQAYMMQNGPLTLMLVPQIGGRVMSMQWRGVDLSYTQPERQGMLEDVSLVSDVRARKREMGFPFWGGEKTWLAPQEKWVDALPLYDLDSGAYTMAIEEEGPRYVVVRMTSPVCRESGMQITRTVTVTAGSTEWSVTHQLQNRSEGAAQWGVWDVSMIIRPGRVYLPTHPGSPYLDGIKTFTEEGESASLRERVLKTWPGFGVISCEEQGKFKYGVDPNNQRAGPLSPGWMLGIMDVAESGLIAYRKNIPLFAGLPYGHGCFAEVYNSDVYPYFEMETHGPLVRLQAGDSFELKELHALFDVEKWPTSWQEILQLAGTATS